MTQAMDEVRTTCERCGHSSDDHRFDDYTLRAGYNASSPDAAFRCVGPDLRGCDQRCPNMVRAAHTAGQVQR